MAKAAAKSDAGDAAPAKEGKKKTSAVGPRDGKKAFNRVKNILSKLDPDVRQNVVNAIIPIGQLSDGDEGEGSF